MHSASVPKSLCDRARSVSASLPHATNDVVWEWDVQNDKVTFSENFKAIYGHHVDENGIPSGHWFDFVHPDDRGRVVTGISTLLASSGRVWWSEHRIRRADGAYANIFDRASVIYDPDGKPVKMVGVMIDMTERKQAEEKIREQAALLDKAQDAIIVLDLEDCVVYWNKSAERIYGWSAEEAVGQSLKQLFFRGDSPPELLETVKNVRERGEWVGELREFTKEGRQIIVQARPTLIHDGQGQPKGVLIINTDITERKLLEEQFLRAQRLESLGILVSGIAHDLNNTLSPILMGANMLLTNSPPPETESVLDIMEASARRSKEMVKQMLAFARGGELSKTSRQFRPDDQGNGPAHRRHLSQIHPVPRARGQAVLAGFRFAHPVASGVAQLVCQCPRRHARWWHAYLVRGERATQTR